MERDFLKNLGLDADQISKVMTQYGKDIQEYKENADKLKEFTANNKDLKEQLSQRDDQLKDLKKSAGDNEELKSKLTEALSNNKEQAKQYDEKIAGMQKDRAISDALRAANAKDPVSVKAHLKVDKVSLDNNGNLLGLDDQVKDVKKSYGFLFNEPKEGKTKAAVKASFSGNASDTGNGSKGKSIVDTIAARMAKR